VRFISCRLLSLATCRRLYSEQYSATMRDHPARVTFLSGPGRELVEAVLTKLACATGTDWGIGRRLHTTVTQFLESSA
jgi:hypothetical protein